MYYPTVSGAEPAGSMIWSSSSCIVSEAKLGRIYIDQVISFSRLITVNSRHFADFLKRARGRGNQNLCQYAVKKVFFTIGLSKLGYVINFFLCIKTFWLGGIPNATQKSTSHNVTVPSILTDLAQKATAANIIETLSMTASTILRNLTVHTASVPLCQLVIAGIGRFKLWSLVLVNLERAGGVVGRSYVAPSARRLKWMHWKNSRGVAKNRERNGIRESSYLDSTRIALRRHQSSGYGRELSELGFSEFVNRRLGSVSPVGARPPGVNQGG